MQNVEIEEKVLEHNTVFFGDRTILFSSIKKKSENYFNPVILFEIEKLNISVDDIRRMISFVNKSSEEKKVVLLSSFYWSDESQNAMLKVLEETPANTNIFLFGLSEKYFLKTVLSRVQKVNLKNTNRYQDLAKDILGLDPNERLENKEVKKVLALKAVDFNFEKNTENEKKDREAHILFLFALLNIALLHYSPSFLKRGLGGDFLGKAFLEKLLKISTLAEIEGGSPHLFIEWLLLTTPKI